MRADALVAVLLGAAAFGLYALTAQERLYGDGPFFARDFAARPGGWMSGRHALYLPAASVLWRWIPWDSPGQALQYLSVASGAFGVSCAFGACRAWGAPRAAAVVAAALLALSPAYWFFATTIEVHAFHAACVGFCALVVLLAPWQRPLLAGMLAAGCLPLVFLSHQSGLLLGPGFVLLAQVARARRVGAGFRPRALLLGIGPLFAGSFGVATLLAAALRGMSLPRLLGSSAGFVGFYDRSMTLAQVEEGWLTPLGVLLPLALVGSARAHPRHAAWTAIALILPSLVFFSLWGIAERGGYALGTAAFLAVLAAPGLPGRRALVPLTLLVAVQGAVGLRSLADYDSPAYRSSLESRVHALARALPEGGLLVTLDYPRVDFGRRRPDIQEHCFYKPLAEAVTAELPPAEFVRQVGSRIDVLLRDDDRSVAVDLSHRSFLVERAPVLRDHIQAFDDWVSREASLELLDDPEWPMARLR